MKTEFIDLSQKDKDAARGHIYWMQNEDIAPISVEVNLPDAGFVTLTINGTVYKK